MVPARGHYLRPIWPDIFLPDVQPGGKAWGVRLLASHYIAIFCAIRMALFARDVFRHEFFYRSRTHAPRDGIHALLSRPFVCRPASIFPTPTDVPIPNLIRGKE